MKIVIPGGTGQVGQVLVRHFHAQGHEVIVLSRAPPAPPQPWTTVLWDGLTPGPWTGHLNQADLCLNLAGRTVNCRYHPENRRQIYDSRILSTRLLGQVIAALNHPPRLWMNASTATIYRHALDRPMDELTGELGGNEPGAPDTWNFSIKVAKDWEAAFFETDLPRTRRLALRTAATFSPDPGGVFDIFRQLIRLGLGGTSGPGTQYVSWLHDTDFIRAIEFLIVHENLEGAINLAAPHPLPNRDFMRALREAWGMPIGLPATAWMLEIGSWIMRTETELVLKSRQVIPTRLHQAGFEFQFPHWPPAARDLVSRWRNSTGHAASTKTLLS